MLLRLTKIRTTITTPIPNAAAPSTRSTRVPTTPPESASKENSAELATTSPLNSEFFQHFPNFIYEGNLLTQFSLWNNQKAINSINQTYEIDETIDIWNYRSHILLGELADQVKQFACSGGIWTQTTDVEGEVNGLMTYDRRLARVDVNQWKADIQALYDAAAARSNATMTTPKI